MKRVALGEEEQGSVRSFRRQAETKQRGLKVNCPMWAREGGLGHCDDEGGGSGVSKLDNALACVDDFVTQKLELQDTLETEGRLFGAAPFIYRHGR